MRTLGVVVARGNSIINSMPNPMRKINGYEVRKILFPTVWVRVLGFRLSTLAVRSFDRSARSGKFNDITVI
jgi:hypothetical protein